MGTQKKEICGLGGWLIVFGILFVFGILNTTYGLIDIITLHTQGFWPVLTMPGTEAYHPLWRPLLIFETGAFILTIIFSLVASWLFFTKSYLFPKWIIITILMGFLFFSIDHYVADLIPIVGVESTNRFSMLFRMLGVAIWVPYFLTSRRVKNTFVRRRPEGHIEATDKSNRQPSFFQKTKLVWLGSLVASVIEVFSNIAIPVHGAVEKFSAGESLDLAMTWAAAYLIGALAGTTLLIYCISILITYTIHLPTLCFRGKAEFQEKCSQGKFTFVFSIIVGVVLFFVLGSYQSDPWVYIQ